MPLGEERVRDFIKTIGLYKGKARNVIALSERLIAEKGGVVPADRDYLTTLPGVGRKTANVVLNMAFGQPTMAVDTHVFRVANRLPLVVGRTPEQVEEALLQRVPAQYRCHAHHWLILHGRYTCTARKPAMRAVRGGGSVPEPGEKDLRGVDAPQPNIHKPASPKQPTTIRHQAKGVKPWREMKARKPRTTTRPGEEGGHEADRDQRHVVGVEDLVVLVEVVGEGARHRRHGEEEGEFGGRALGRAPSASRRRSSRGARDTGHHGDHLEEADLQRHQRRDLVDVIGARLQIELVDGEQHEAAGDQRDADDLRRKSCDLMNHARRLR